jgi:hypothetical protein
MQGEKHGFLENGRRLFLGEGLDRGNQVEIARENRGFGARLGPNVMGQVDRP